MESTSSDEMVCHSNGRSLLQQQLGDFTGKVSALDEKFSAWVADIEAKNSAEIESLKSKHSARMAALEAQMSTLLPFKGYFLDVRERAYSRLLD